MEANGSSPVTNPVIAGPEAGLLWVSIGMVERIRADERRCETSMGANPSEEPGALWSSVRLFCSCQSERKIVEGGLPSATRPEETKWGLLMIAEDANQTGGGKLSVFL